MLTAKIVAIANNRQAENLRTGQTSSLAHLAIRY